MDTNQNNAENLLSQLAHLKAKDRHLQAEIKAVQLLLSHCADNGDLDHLKTEASSTYRFEEANFVYCPGRITWSYDGCADVQAAAENLKELQETAQAIGQAVRKQGKPFWTVR